MVLLTMQETGPTAYHPYPRDVSFAKLFDSLCIKGFDFSDALSLYPPWDIVLEHLLGAPIIHVTVGIF